VFYNLVKCIEPESYLSIGLSWLFVLKMKKIRDPQILFLV